MANKKDVYNAFYEGVTIILDGNIDVNIWDLPIDHDEYQEWLNQRGYDHILEFYQ